MIKNPIFVLGMQRSGTSYVFDILKQFTDTVPYDDDNPQAFNNFLLADVSVIQNLVSLHPAKVSLFKAISDTIKLITLPDMFPNAGFILIYRSPKLVVNSYAYEFSNGMDIINHIINFDFFYDRMKTITGKELELPRIRQVLERFAGRFSSMADGADKIGLYWSLFHLILLESDMLDTEPLILTSYEEATTSPSKLRDLIQGKLLSGRKFIGELPPVTSRRLFFAERISDDVLQLCNSIYEELGKHLTSIK
jgi:hypothetical protein